MTSVKEKKQKETNGNKFKGALNSKYGSRTGLIDNHFLIHALPFVARIFHLYLFKLF